MYSESKEGRRGTLLVERGIGEDGLGVASLQKQVGL